MPKEKTIIINKLSQKLFFKEYSGFLWPNFLACQNISTIMIPIKPPAIAPVKLKTLIKLFNPKRNNINGTEQVRAQARCLFIFKSKVYISFMAKPRAIKEVDIPNIASRLPNKTILGPRTFPKPIVAISVVEAPVTPITQKIKMP